MATAAKNFLAFDRYQFHRPPQPVSEYDGAEGFTTVGISYDDYRSMHMVKDSGPVRRLETPWWVSNKPFLRELITRYMEARAQIRHREPIGHRDRLHAAMKRLKERRPKLIEMLDKLAAEFVECREPARKKQLQIEIESIDTQLVHLGNEAPLLAGVLHFYHGCGYESPEVAHSLGIKPPYVRMILWRLNKIARKMVAEGWKPGRKKNRRLKFDLEKAVALRKQGLSFEAIGNRLGVTGSGVHHNLQAHGFVHAHEPGYKTIHGGARNRFVSRRL